MDVSLAAGEAVSGVGSCLTALAANLVVHCVFFNFIFDQTFVIKHALKYYICTNLSK